MSVQKITLAPLSKSRRTQVEHKQLQALRATAFGTLQDLFASVLSLPLGLVVAALLSRSLGPDGYGVLSVAVSVVLWIEISITWGFSRTAVKFIAKSRDWQPVASALINAQFLISILVAGCLAAASTPISVLLNSPELGPYLRLLSLDIPFFALANIHISVLIGRGQFSRRALLTAVYSFCRLLLVVLFVSLGFAIQGAILAYIGASVVLLICCRFFVHPPVILQTGFSLAGLWDYTLPLLIFTVAMNLFQRVDLLLVKALDMASDAAGHYGAAQNIAGVLGLFAAAFTPILLATLSRMAEQSTLAQAKWFSKQSFRLMFWLLPLLAVAAASSEGIMRFVYGHAFVAGAPVLMLLLLTGLGRLFVAVATSTLTAAGRPDLAAKLVLPALPLAMILDILLIPQFGMVAAAAVTTILTWGVVALLLVAVRQVWHICISSAVFLRCLTVAAFVFFVMNSFPDNGLWLFINLTVGSVLSLAGLALVHEFRYAEMLQWIALFQQRPVETTKS